jgi:hypothetical protein
MRSIAIRCLPAFIFLGCSVQYTRAQSIGHEGNIPRVYGPGPRMFNDEPFSHRYNYGVSPQFYFNGDARQMWHQEYLDRVDRAERFGYDMPDRPRYGYPPDYDRPRLFQGGGIGFGFFKRR